MSQLCGSWSACSRRSAVTSWPNATAVYPRSMLIPTTTMTSRCVALLAIVTSSPSALEARGLLARHAGCRFVDEHIAKQSLHEGLGPDGCAIGGTIHDPQALAAAQRRCGVRKHVWREDLWIIVALEDKSMVVLVPLEPECRPLPPLD